MADNLTTQSAAPATPPAATGIAAAEGDFSGNNVYAGVGLLAKSAGAEGARTFSLVNPATEENQQTDALTDAELRASPVPVDGPLTDAELRATPVPVSGTVTAAQATASSLNAQVQGPAAHSATAAGNPLLNGNEAIAYGTNPTAVDAGEVTKAYANRAGVPFVLGGHPNIITLEAAYTDAQTNTAIITISAGSKIAITQIQGIADAANSVDVGFRIGFGATTTPTTTGVVLTHPGIKASSGSGVSRGDGSAVIGIGADGEDLRITSEVPTGGSLRVLVSYFTIES